MDFRTPVKLTTSEAKLDITDHVLTLGSCFSESIGNKLLYNKFDTLINPFGTIYDPLSISRLLGYTINDQEPENITYIKNEGVYKNMDLHSSYTGMAQSELQLKIKGNFTTTKKQLQSAKWLIITYGTAYVYRHIESSRLVANCHKLPAVNFNKELLSVKQLMIDFKSLYKQLIEFNPSIRIIVTVSPVRHLRDGISENSVSKSILRVFTIELTQTYEIVIYYPSYEIMIDDLRDYRYYNSDMIHPTDQAIDYIWDHFSRSLINEETMNFINKWSKIGSSLQHKPFNPTTEKHQQFLKKLLQDLESLPSNINVEKEVKLVQSQIL